MNDFKYIGSELELFAVAHNWKSYWAGVIRQFVTGDVLEVGAGIGSNTRFLNSEQVRRWVCLEPDEGLARKLAHIRTNHRADQVLCGTVLSLDATQLFDTIVYIDVLEHIEDDRGELLKAAGRLKPGGRIVVLSPAHQRLFTRFDASIGHYRRYNRSTLIKIAPDLLRLEQMIYLDSIGLFASAANRILLRQAMPSPGQLRLWDSWMIPASRVLDRLLGYSLGKTIVAVWRLPHE